jgi:hypothetical protein
VRSEINPYTCLTAAPLHQKKKRERASETPTRCINLRPLSTPGLSHFTDAVSTGYVARNLAE